MNEILIFHIILFMLLILAIELALLIINIYVEHKNKLNRGYEKIFNSYNKIIIGITKRDEINSLFKGIKNKSHKKDILKYSYYFYTSWYGGAKLGRGIAIMLDYNDIVISYRLYKIG